LAFLSSVIAPPPGEPRLQYLVAGFIVLVVGLAALTRRRAPGPVATDPQAPRRATGFVITFVLCATCFARVLGPALVTGDRSPWLLALGDVLCVTLGLFAWVVALAEGRTWSEYGFRGAPAARFMMALVLGLAVVAYFGSRDWARVFSGRVPITGDTLVFAIAFAVVGTAFPEEMLFRGYLQGGLEARHSRWVGLLVPAIAYAALRSLRHLPGQDLSVEDWLRYVLGVAVPLALWWGFVRDIARGSLWPTFISNLLLELGRVLAGAPPVALTHRG
jgi:membrane protease YdiL (CAAX protease family)